MCNLPGSYKSKEELEEHRKKAEEYKAKDEVVGGSPYNEFTIQPIEFVLDNEDALHPTDAFLLNNVLKYLCRHREKGGKEDLEKAVHYIQMVVEHTYED